MVYLCRNILTLAVQTLYYHLDIYPRALCTTYTVTTSPIRICTPDLYPLKLLLWGYCKY